MAVAMDQVINKLNSFLRGELSAVESYRQALGVFKDPTVSAEVQQCLQSHQDRVMRLRERIMQMGGEPADSSGLWGAFAKTVQGGADLLGESAAIAALEEGEDHGLRDYRTDISMLDMDTRTFVQNELLPSQQRTHQLMSSLKHSRNIGAPGTTTTNYPNRPVR